MKKHRASSIIQKTDQGMVTIQKVFFFFDDSGVLHQKEKSGYFVYGGFVFTSREELDKAKHKYINANKKLKEELHRNDELKAAGLDAKHKRALYMSIREFESVSCSVRIDYVYNSIMSDKKSICRYKDYVLKRCIKAKLEELIKQGEIKSDEDIVIEVNVDEQLTATDGYYSLQDSIREELQHGIVNFDYGKFYEPVFKSEVKVNLRYCESKNNYMIQASDILANRIWTSFRVSKKELLISIPNHLHLTFP